MFESERIEFKEKLTEKFEREVVSFLNTTHGGSIYIGISDDGSVTGLDNINSAQLEVKDRIKNNISPSAMGLFEIITHSKNGKDYLQVLISGGNQRPYYIRKFGMCPEGCYFRLGSSTEKMSDDMILSLFQKREKSTLLNTASPVQNLTFDYLLEQYRRNGYDVGDNLLVQLQFFMPSGDYNYLAYLLSDQNSLYIQYARYATEDVFDLVERKAFTNQSLLKTAKELYDFLQNHNTTYCRILPTERLELEKVNSTALKEIVTNALVHNDYRKGGLPTFEEFTDRLEISSYGGLPTDVSLADFFNGYSLPVNPELIRVFRDLRIAESLGTGIRRVLHYYPREIFRFSTNFLRVSIPFTSPEDLRKEEKKGQKTVLDMLRVNPDLTIRELSLALGVSVSTVNREVARLMSEGKLARVGSRKTGSWYISESSQDLMAAEKAPEYGTKN